jgi:hypothetical protein
MEAMGGRILGQAVLVEGITLENPEFQAWILLFKPSRIEKN